MCVKLLRQQVAIVFLVLISLQAGGYYAIMEFLKLQLSKQTAYRIAKEQAPIGAHLVLKIPVSSVIPEHFTYEANVYQVIERHVYDGVLYVVCIRDDRATDAQETIDSFVQSLAGKSNNDESAGVKFFENLSKYFFTEAHSLYVVTAGWATDLPFGTKDLLYSFNHQDLPFHPPSVIASII